MFLDCSWTVLGCSGIVPKIFFNCCSFVLGFFLDCSLIGPGLFLDCSWLVPGLFLGYSWMLLDCSWIMFLLIFANVLAYSWIFLGLFLECFWIVLHCSRIVLGCSWMLASFAQPESASKSHVLSGSHSIRFTGGLGGPKWSKTRFSERFF